jgi:hypothetical protein
MTDTVKYDDVTMDAVIDMLSKRQAALQQEAKQLEGSLFANIGATREIEGQLNIWRIRRGLDEPALTMAELQAGLQRGQELPPE